MNLITWVTIACLAPAAFWWNRLRRMNVRLAKPKVSFGPKESRLSNLEHGVILRSCIEQQRLAFALVWVAVVLGVILAAIVVIAFITESRFTSAKIPSVAGLLGDFTLAGSAIKVYQASNLHLIKALETIESSTRGAGI